MPPLSFSILGPLEIRSGTFVRSISGKPGVVLATLLLNPGEPVSTERLIDVLWGESPPETARAALQVHVSKLRKILDDAGAGDPVQTRSPGYLLQIEPDDIDAVVFDRSVGEAREALGEGDLPRARRLLADALPRWRGRPFDGLDAPGLPREQIGALEDRRHDAMVLRCEVELMLGGHHGVIGDLGSLAADRPLDEHVTELLALALHRGGRTGEALQAIGSLRRVLSEELGMDPGGALMQLEGSILAGDPTLLDTQSEAEVVVGEHRKTVTALVCRVGQDGVDLETRGRALDELTRSMRATVDPLGGEQVVGAGNRVVATFGVRALHEDDVVRAVRAATAVLDQAARDGHSIAVGIQCGEALVESAGPDRTLLTADPLEQAERLAAAARPGEVLLGSTALSVAGGAIEVDPSPVVLGDLDEVAYRVLRVSDHRPRAGHAPFVGREDELATLRHAFERTIRDHATSLVTVTGDAGIGKSRLIAEFLDGCSTDVTGVVARCLPYGRDITYWPIAEVIRTIAGITQVDSADDARAKLAAMLAADDDASYLASQAEVVLGLGDASPAPDELHWAIRRCLELAAEDRPLVIVFDDLQFADDAMIDLLGYLAASARATPLFLVGVARRELTDRRSSWVDRAGVVEVRLQPLDHTSVLDLLSRLAGDAAIEPAPLSRIVETGSGNPLFLAELFRMLAEQGRLVLEDDAWRAVGDLSSIELPPSVHQLLAARVDELPPGDRRVLDAAAVVGEEFGEHDVVALLVDSDEQMVMEALRSLERRDVVLFERFARGSGRVFRFRHLMLRDAVYRSVPKGHRARDHERFAEMLDARAGARIPEVEEIVGYHLETALELRRELGAGRAVLEDLGGRAARRFTSAGRRAVMRDDDAAAAGLFARGIACLPTADDARIELWWRRVIALIELGRFPQAEEAAQTGLAEAARAGDDVGRWRLLVERLNLEWFRSPEGGSLAELREAANEAVDTLEALGDDAGLVRAERLLHDALVTEGYATAATRAAQRGAAHAARAGEYWDRDTVGSLLGPVPAEVLIEGARRHLETKAWNRPETISKMGASLALASDETEAREQLASGLALARELGVELRVADALMVNAYGLLYLGDPAGAAEALKEGVAVLEALDEQGMRSTALALLAESWYRLGHLEDALEATDAAQRLGLDDDHATQATWRRVRAKLLASRGQTEAGHELARAAVAIADRTEFLPMAAEAHADLAEVLWMAGRDEEAATEARAAIELFERKGATAGVTFVRERWGKG